MYRRILVPLDGSEVAESALPMAEALARTMGAELRLAHAVVPLPDYSYKTPQDDMSWEERAEEVASAYLEDTAESLESRGQDRTVRWDVLRGRASDALAAHADREDIDLVVMTTHGEGGIRSFWLGSVADELLRKSTIPVLFVRPDEAGGSGVGEKSSEVGAGKPSLGTVLLALDGSPGAEAAVDHAREIAGAMGATLSLVQVMSPGIGIAGLRADPAAAERSGLTEEARKQGLEYLSGVAAEIREAVGSELETTLDVFGADHPAEGILEREGDADLVVMATHGRTGLDRMVVGSVTDKVLRGGKKPLLVVRTAEESPGSS